ncbi:hypothetical protein NC653_040650 [Populus alba x Populus x berolinensis]|uniref:Uncharacterized protein n=3 Tax=Populus TaxID=3689 RepID=A0AAD6PN26_9ROSI|nr:hypothetical protein NC653_040650 [Populus alba x Populus x berolinensis]
MDAMKYFQLPCMAPSSFSVFLLNCVIHFNFIFRPSLCGIYVEGSASGSDDDHDRHDAAEEETDDDDEFLDTQDFLSSSSFKSAESEFQKTPYDSDEDEGPLDIEDGMDSCIKFVGSNYPCVMRRKKLPDPVEKEKGVSLWSMIKDDIGKDLTRVCLPVYFNEPISSLQKCFEDLEYSFLLDRANEFDKMGNSLMRALNVAAFAVSGYASTDGRHCKPFNPLLGETYEAALSLRRLVITQWLLPAIVRVEAGDFGVKVLGGVQDKNGKTVASLFGKWDDSMHYKINGGSRNANGSEPHLLWKRSKPSKHLTRYNLTRFAITLNELTPELKEKLPSTDSRLRPDQRCLENGEYTKANEEKLRLEQRQRQARKMQERGWKPRWFVKEKGGETYSYIGGYWEAKDRGNWESCPDIFGQVSTDQNFD